MSGSALAAALAARAHERASASQSKRNLEREVRRRGLEAYAAARWVRVGAPRVAAAQERLALRLAGRTAASMRLR